MGWFSSRIWDPGDSRRKVARNRRRSTVQATLDKQVSKAGEDGISVTAFLLDLGFPRSVFGTEVDEALEGA